MCVWDFRTLDQNLVPLPSKNYRGKILVVDFRIYLPQSDFTLLVYDGNAQGFDTVKFPWDTIMKAPLSGPKTRPSLFGSSNEWLYFDCYDCRYNEYHIVSAVAVKEPEQKSLFDFYMFQAFKIKADGTVVETDRAKMQIKFFIPGAPVRSSDSHGRLCIAGKSSTEDRHTHLFYDASYRGGRFTLEDWPIDFWQFEHHVFANGVCYAMTSNRTKPYTRFSGVSDFYACIADRERVPYRWKTVSSSMVVQNGRYVQASESIAGDGCGYIMHQHGQQLTVLSFNESDRLGKFNSSTERRRISGGFATFSPQTSP